MAKRHRPAPPPGHPLIVRCGWPGGGAGRCRQAESTSNMRADVGLWPAGEVEFGTRGQEIETGLGEMLAAFARQPPVEVFAQRVEETDVGGGIVALRLGQPRTDPVRRLLLLGDVLAAQSPPQLLPP